MGILAIQRSFSIVLVQDEVTAIKRCTLIGGFLSMV